MQTKNVIDALASIRKNGALVHNITNYVVMNNTANALLAIGASPVMAHAIEEVSDMVKIASSLVINMGTLDAHWVDSMMVAGKEAKTLNKPLVFDPVGSGATPYRTKVAHQIIDECNPCIIRGNASEIMSLVDSTIKTSGVDSSVATNKAEHSACILAKKHHCVVVVSGPEDYITDGNHVVRINNGSTMMSKVTGTGCTCTAILGAFVAVCDTPFDAASCGMAVMAIAGQKAAEISKGPASLQLNLIDLLYTIDAEMIQKEILMTYE